MINALVAPSPSTVGVLLRGCGSATPNASISNDALGRRVETSDAWIRSRTGIGARRVIASDESIAELSALAAERALTMADWSAESLDLILLATSTPDDLFGSAPRLQSRLKAFNAVAFDLTAACSGFLFGLVTAAQYLRSGAMKRILIVGADQLSRWVDWDDRRSCVLFGDAAGAVLLEASTDQRDDLEGYLLRSDGRRGSRVGSMPTNCESKRRSRISLVGTLKAATPLPSHCGSGARCWPQRLSCLMSTQSRSGKSSVRFR